MAATLDFTSFFTMAFLGAAPFFTAWLFLIRLLFTIANPKADFPILYPSFYPQDLKKFCKYLCSFMHLLESFLFKTYFVVDIIHTILLISNTH